MALDELQQLIAKNAGDKGALLGLDERMATANALRKSTPSMQRDTGYVDPMSAIASLFEAQQGRDQAAEYRPMQEAARGRVLDTAAAKENYGLRLAADKVSRDQGNFENTAAAKVGASSLLAKAKAAAANKKAAALLANQARQQGNIVSEAAVAEQTERTRVAERAEKARVAASSGTPAYLQNADTGEEARGTVMPTGQVMMDGQPVGSEWTVLQKDAKGRTRSSRGGGGKGEENPFAKVADADTVIRLITNPLLGSGTGLNPDRYLSRFGVTTGDDPERGPKLQAMSRDIADIGIDTVKENLEGLGVNPTDADLKIAFRSVPDQGTQPLAWLDWLENNYRPLYEKSYNDAIDIGKKKPEERDAYLAAIDKAIAQGREMWKGDVEVPNDTTQAVDTQAIDDELAEIERKLGAG